MAIFEGGNMQVFIVLVKHTKTNIPLRGDMMYVHAVFAEKVHADEDAERFLRHFPGGWAEVQSFNVV